ncbi:MAG: hypothetical protein LQ348_005986, partial [Seirophora lacunosa]
MAPPNYLRGTDVTQISIIRDLHLDFEISNWSKIASFGSLVSAALVAAGLDLANLIELQDEPLKGSKPVSTAFPELGPLSTQDLATLVAKTQTQRRTLIDVLRILEDQAAVIRSHEEAHGKEFEMDLLLVPGRRIRFVYDSGERDQAARDFGFMVSAMEREEVKK